MSDSESKLRFGTLAYRRVLASEYDELAPLVLPTLTSYGSEDRTRTELSLALSEIPEEGKPATVARLLFPDGVRLEHIEVELSRTELTGRLGRAHKATVTVIVVPELRPRHWARSQGTGCSYRSSTTPSSSTARKTSSSACRPR